MMIHDKMWITYDDYMIGHKCMRGNGCRVLYTVHNKQLSDVGSIRLINIYG